METIKEEDCNFCNPILKEKYDLDIVCPKYLLVYRDPINKNSKELLDNIFSSNKFYLPIEIVLIIYDYIELIKTNKIKKINANSILHIGKCDDCAHKLIKFYNNKLCNRHLLPYCVFSENI